MLLLAGACSRGAPAEYVQYLEITPDLRWAGTQLPPWAACWFPHRANGGAVRRAQPCPAETVATRVYQPRDVAGCWRLRFPGGRRADETAFWNVPIRLRMTPAGDRGEREIRTESPPLSGERAPWERGARTTWGLIPPDTLTIARSMGMGATVLTFRVRGDSLVGMEQQEGDVLWMTFDTATDSVRAVTGRRTACARSRRA